MIFAKALLVGTALGLAGAGAIVACAPATSAAAVSVAPVYRPPVWSAGDAPGTTFALVAFVETNAGGESFTVDRDLSRDDCASEARGELALDDIGVRIAVETAAEFYGARLRCIAERAT